MYTLGTAGHVDHGKSTLVQALTGINPDRWEEEQRREMTIDLGFAWLTLPSGESISLIDVPGHERFIKNMLAGAGGIDAVLLIIAADEGIQPQTVEHLQIIDLLGIEHGLIVLTKSDLVDDEWLGLIEQEVREHLAATTLAHAPILAVSARTGAGLPTLQGAIDTLLKQIPKRHKLHAIPRLPIDRAFSIKGFGTVVTGTLLDGSLTSGMEIEIQPSGLRGRIRGLQQHQQTCERSESGSRVAVNLSGIDRQAIQRGHVLTLPDTLIPTQLLDIQLRLTSDAPPLRHNDPFDVFIGAAHSPCHVALLEHEILRAGQQGWVQVRLSEPLAVVRGDRCILRRPSPSQTIGGGSVVEAHPARHRRFRPTVISALEIQAEGTPEERLLQTLALHPPLAWRDAVAQSGLDDATARAAFASSCNRDAAMIVVPTTTEVHPTTLVTSRERWDELLLQLRGVLDTYHQRWPLRQGMPKEEIRSRLGLATKPFNASIERSLHEQVLESNGASVWLTGHQPQPTASEHSHVERLLAAWEAAPTTPPGREILETLAPDLHHWILETGRLIRITDDIFFLPQTVAAMLGWVQERLASHGTLTLAEFRDAWQTTRKYAQAFLEYTDSQRITRRNGDERVAF